jgi:hypothetical protein
VLFIRLCMNLMQYADVIFFDDTWVRYVLLSAVVLVTIPGLTFGPKRLQRSLRTNLFLAPTLPASLLLLGP